MDDMIKVSELAERFYDDGEHLKRWYHRGWWLGGMDQKPEPVQGGDTLSWGDYHGRTWTGMMGSHNEVNESDVESFQPLLEIPGCGRGDYNDTSVYDRSNLEYLQEHYGEYVVTVGRSSHDGQALALPMDSEIPEGLAELVEKLDEYPEPIDWDHCHALQQRIVDECWPIYLEHDMRREVETALAELCNLDKYETDLSEYLDGLLTEERDFKAVFWEAMELTETDFEYETSESAIIRDSETVAQKIAELLTGKES